WSPRQRRAAANGAPARRASRAPGVASRRNDERALVLPGGGATVAVPIGRAPVAGCLRVYWLDGRRAVRRHPGPGRRGDLERGGAHDRGVPDPRRWAGARPRAAP